MKNPFGKYRLSVKNFRAIAKADITLDGITVVAGINACGKSTISKLFYEIFDVSNRWEEIAYRPFFDKYEAILYKISDSISFWESRKGVGGGGRRFFYRRTEGESVEKRKKAIESFLNSVKEKLEYRENLGGDEELEPVSLWGKRLLRTLEAEWLEELNVDEDPSEQEDPVSLFKRILETYRKNFERNLQGLTDLVRFRHFSILRDELINTEFSDVFNAKSSVDFYDDDGLLTDRERNIFGEILGVEDVYYYDTPFCIAPEFRRSRKEYYARLHKALRIERRKQDASQKEIVAQINREFTDVLNGNVYFDKDIAYDYRFMYQREDGANFNLEKCATGIKSFGILQMLLNNGVLTNKTAVIIDEPEAHLHPAWIVEFARLIILINKRLGTRFLIATHNPDMTSALRCISEKEGTLASTRFYLAEESSESPYQYVFEEAVEDDKNIEPLFASFANALYKIADYSDGGENDEE